VAFFIGPGVKGGTMDYNKLTTIETIFDAEEIAAGEDTNSRVFDFRKLAGNASLQITLTGNGTGKFEWVGTNDETAAVAAFIKPNNANDIVTAFTRTSGPGGDGKHIYGFNISLVRKAAIKVTETSATDTITVTAILAVQ